MTDLEPSQVLLRLRELQRVDLTANATQTIRAGGKAGRQESHKLALLDLNRDFEQYFVAASVLALGLNSTQAKKIRYKKDRVRIFKAHGVDYMAIDGAQTAQVLAQIAQAIEFEDAIVTQGLHDIFPYWKEGFPMVQLDNAYKILAEDIQLHYEQVLQRFAQL